MRCAGLLALVLSSPFAAHAQLSYSLAGGNGSWPADKRAAIVAAMDAAVALYNANGYFPTSLTANYNAGVPTAQGSYSGWIDFGGSISTRVALHEISHTLGVGTVAAWNSNRSGSAWSGSRANARLAVFDGTGAVLNCDSIHFWPYGLNYDSEDGTTNRVRHIKMVAALRWDMGIVTDSDGDGMPDDWETFHFGNLAQTAAGDWDADGTGNLAEYNADSNPATAFAFTWMGGSGAWDTTSANWTGAATRWRNGGNDAATFAGTAGTVTVASGVSTNDMSFATSGYAISGSTLALTGSSPTITTASGVLATVAPVLSGSRGLVKSGAGTLTLTAANAFTGPLTVGGGTLALAPGARLYMNGGSTVTTIRGGGTLSFSGDWGWNGTMRWMGVAADETVIDGGTLQHTGAGNAKTSDGAGRLFTIGAAGATLDSATAGEEFTIGYRTDYGSSLASGAGGTLTLSGAGDGELNYNLPGTGALVKRGAGTWKLTGAANAFSGGTVIGVSTNQGAVGGTLVINDSTSLGTGAISVIAGDTTGTYMGAQLQLTGGITLANPTVAISGLGFGAANGVLRNVSGNNTILGAVQLMGGAGGSVIASDSGKLTLSGGITATYASRTIEFTGAGNVDVTGAIANGTTAALPLTKSGAGTLTLTGANMHSGTTTISGGVLQIGANGASGTLGTGSVTNNALLRFHRNDKALVVSNAIGGTGALEFGVSSGGSLAAETTLSGSNTFTGNITISSGGVRITRSDALGTGTKTVTMTNGTNGNCRLILDGSASPINLPAAISLTTSNTNTTYPAIINEAGNNTISGNFSLMSGGGSTRVRVDAGTLTLSGQMTPAVSGRTLQLDGDGTGILSGALKNSSNTVGLEKSGAGTWTLSGNGHTYTGATTIHAGCLALTGTLASAITATGGTFAPQGSPVTSGALNISGGGRFEIRINGAVPGTQYDRLTASGSVTLAGNLDVIAAPGLPSGTTFTIINKTSAGAVSGTFSEMGEGRVFPASGYNWLISYTGGDGNDVTLTIATALQSWRFTHFGTTENSGNSADAADSNGDGEENLFEFATGQNPHANTRNTPTLARNGATMEFTYTRANAAIGDGVTIAVETSDDLTGGSWRTTGITESIVPGSDNGTTQMWKASIPAGAGPKRFVRLRVLSPRP